MKKILAFLLFYASCFSIIQSSQPQSICEEIIENRKKQGGVNNPEYLNSLQKFKLIKHDACIIELQPKYVWAQNMSFIMVKFDFQLSSRTSCSQILMSEKNVTYNGFSLKQYCIQSDQIIKYQIDVKTYKNLNFHFARWKQIQMNGLILEVLKSPTPYFWPKLYSKFTNPSHKPRIWWELQQKQDESVQKYMGLLEIDESEIEVSSYVKKRSSKNDFNRKDSDIDFYCNEGSPYLLGSWH